MGLGTAIFNTAGYLLWVTNVRAVLLCLGSYHQCTLFYHPPSPLPDKVKRKPAKRPRPPPPPPAAPAKARKRAR